MHTHTFVIWVLIHNTHPALDVYMLWSSKNSCHHFILVCVFMIFNNPLLLIWVLPPKYAPKDYQLLDLFWSNCYLVWNHSLFMLEQLLTRLSNFGWVYMPQIVLFGFCRLLLNIGAAPSHTTTPFFVSSRQTKLVRVFGFVWTAGMEVYCCLAYVKAVSSLYSMLYGMSSCLVCLWQRDICGWYCYGCYIYSYLDILGCRFLCSSVTKRGRK